MTVLPPGRARLNPLLSWMLSVGSLQACAVPEPAADAPDDLARVAAEVEAAVWSFHAADTARDRE